MYFKRKQAYLEGTKAYLEETVNFEGTKAYLEGTIAYFVETTGKKAYLEGTKAYLELTIVSVN